MTDNWFSKAFGSYYPELYAHRDDGEAKRAITLLSTHTPLADARVLDVACGAGRHLTALAASGARPHGIDLSLDLLHRVDRSRSFARADMRNLPFRDGVFDGVTNMFTSFGYFENRAENTGVLSEIARVLRQGGWFFLDYLDSATVLRNLVPTGERQAGGLTIKESRSYDPERKRLTKEVELHERAGGMVDHWTEVLHLFDRTELEEAARDAGFQVKAVAGDYDGNPPSEDTNRLILFCVNRSIE